MPLGLLIVVAHTVSLAYEAQFQAEVVMLGNFYSKCLGILGNLNKLK